MVWPSGHSIYLEGAFGRRGALGMFGMLGLWVIFTILLCAGFPTWFGFYSMVPVLDSAAC